MLDINTLLFISKNPLTPLSDYTRLIRDEPDITFTMLKLIKILYPQKCDTINLVLIRIGLSQFILFTLLSHYIVESGTAITSGLLERCMWKAVKVYNPIQKAENIFVNSVTKIQNYIDERE